MLPPPPTPPQPVDTDATVVTDKKTGLPVLTLGRQITSRDVADALDDEA